MTQYRNVALGELSPHVYAIAEQVSVTATCRCQAHVYLAVCFAMMHDSMFAWHGMPAEMLTAASKCQHCHLSTCKQVSTITGHNTS